MAVIRMVDDLRQSLRHLPLMGPLGAALAGMAWLLPNSYKPWPAFHSDAWLAGVMIALALVMVWRSASWKRPSRATLVLFAVATIPLWQWMLGVISLSGHAAMSAAYLLGLALAYAIGEQSSRAEAGLGAAPHLMFGAVAFAAVVSVGLQLYQWLGLTRDQGLLDIWVLHVGDHGRAYANMAQPNQLATLLLWGLVALGWARHHRVMGAVATAAAAFLLVVGLALTQSRAALLGATLAVVYVIALPGSIFSRAWKVSVGALVLVYGMALMLVGPISRWLLLDVQQSMLTRTRGELRWETWLMFLDAVWARPWLGHGWEQARRAQLEVFPAHPNMAQTYFSHSHNLLIDLIVWCGIPLGMTLIALLVIWLWRRVRRVSSRDQALLVLPLLLVGVHSLFELPLSYAYFLLPAGLFAGCLAGVQRGTHAVSLGRRASQHYRGLLLGLLLGASILLGVIVRDYLLIEAALLELRFEAARIGTHFTRRAPDTWLLREWHDLIDMTRSDARVVMSASQLRRWEALVLHYPSAANFERLITALAHNGQMDRAEYWVTRMKLLLIPPAGDTIEKRWRAGLSQAAGPASLSLPRQ